MENYIIFYFSLFDIYIDSAQKKLKIKEIYESCNFKLKNISNIFYNFKHVK